MPAFKEQLSARFDIPDNITGVCSKLWNFQYMVYIRSKNNDNHNKKKLETTVFWKCSRVYEIFYISASGKHVNMF